MENQEFTVIPKFYDELMSRVPYKTWVRYIQEILDRLKYKPKTVLELACGTGTVSMLLEDLGYQVQGVDCSEGMICEAKNKASQRGYKAQFFVENLVNLDLEEKNFDLEVCLFDSLNYILNPSDLQEALNRAARHLHAGGYFIFDINTVYALAAELFTQEDLNPDAEPQYIWKSRFDPESRISEVNMDFHYHGKDYKETHYERAYELDEIEWMLKKAGFHVEAIYDAYSFRKPFKRSDRVFFVARRRNVIE